MVFYPDNLNRSRRVEQLINDCSNLEQFVIDEGERMDQRDPFIRPTIDRIMRENGLTTFTELKDKVLSLLPPDLRIQYERLAENAVDSAGRIDSMLMIISCIAITGGAVAVGASFARFIAIGGITIAMRAASTGLRLTLLGQAGAALAYFRRAGNLSSVVRVTNLANPRFLRILSVVQTTARVVGWIAFGLDIFLLILSAIQGAQQRTELQKATRDLFSRRLQMRLLQMQASVAASFKVQAEAHLRIADDTRDLLAGIPGITEEIILNAIANAEATSSERIGNEISVLQDNNSFEVAEQRLREQDNGRNSWTSEDPTFAEAMHRIEQETEALSRSFAKL